MSINNNGANANNFPFNGGLTGNYTIYYPTTTQWITVPIVVDPALVSTEPKKKEFDCKCTKCKELYPYAAEPEEGKDFICWACRHGF